MITLIRTYLECIGSDESTIRKVDNYLKLIIGRASGKLYTGAKWMREFVTNHKDYKHDSVITQKMAYDLVKKISDVYFKIKID